MKERERMIREYVLEAASNDYESFDQILKQVMRWLTDHRQRATRAEILAALEHVIREGYAQPYSLSPERAQPVNFSPERLDELWFYVTPKGKQLVQTLK